MVDSGVHWPNGVVSVLPIAARAGAEEEFERAFGELAVFDHACHSRGFRSGRLLRPLESGQPFLVVAEWDDAASYRRWLGNPVREELKAKLAPLVAEDVLKGGLYAEVP